MEQGKQRQPSEASAPIAERSTDQRLGDRRQQERRDGDRREKDRRQNALSARLRYGFWKVYRDKYDVDKKALLAYNPLKVTWLVDDLTVEAKRYRFFNKHDDHKTPYEQVLKAAIEEVVKASKGRDRQAFAMIEEVAETILKTYRLEAKDRREEDRRSDERRQGERRNEAHHKTAERNHLN